MEVNRKVSQQRCPPLFFESDVKSDSDYDSQPELDSDFEARGGDEVMDKDLWNDQPVQRQVSEPSPKPSQDLSVPAKSQEEAISPEEDTSKNEFDVGDSFGRGPDGRNKRERKDVNYKEPHIYKCS